MEHKGLLFEIVIVGLPSKIVTVEHKGLGIIFLFISIFKFKKTNFKL